MWGAATHDFAEGVHRPPDRHGAGAPTDDRANHSVCSSGSTSRSSATSARLSDSERILSPVRDALGLTDGQLLVNCSHTHSSPWAATSRSHMPGGELIGPYLDQMGQAILEAGLEAVANLVPATLTWATGSCDLAAKSRPPRPGAGQRSRLLRVQPAQPSGRHPRRRTGDARQRRRRASRRSSTTPAIRQRWRGTTG